MIYLVSTITFFAATAGFASLGISIWQRAKRTSEVRVLLLMLAVFTLRELETQLDPEQFARAHRQTILSLSYIAEIEPSTSGCAVARLRSGLSFRISRHAASLREKLGW